MKKRQKLQRRERLGLRDQRRTPGEIRLPLGRNHESMGKWWFNQQTLGFHGKKPRNIALLLGFHGIYS